MIFLKRFLILFCSYSTNTDPTFLQLQIDRRGNASNVDDVPLGLLNWFSVHPTSMDGSNRLISSDNKGRASLILEKRVNGKEGNVGKESF